MSEFVVPHDPEAEADLLAAMMIVSPDRTEALRHVVATDFYSPLHARMFVAIAGLHEDGRVVDEGSVGHAIGLARQDVLTWRLKASPMNVVEHLRRVLEASDRRATAKIATILREQACDPDVSIHEAVDHARSLLQTRNPLVARRIVAYEDWAAGISLDWSWIVPGWLEHGDRVILVAGEGVGKSWLLRCWAFMAAAGVNPFTLVSIKPARCLIIDAENSSRQIVRASARLIAQAQLGGRPWIKDNIAVEPMVGIDLTRRADRAKVEAILEGCRPDILVIGPLYKIFSSNSTKTYEENAMEAATVIDEWRARYGCAVLIEHHAPKGSNGDRDLFPFGSSIWLRWPEFGVTVKQDRNADPTGRTFTMGRFRGDREVRQWPKELMWGNHSTWPWVVPPDERDRMLQSAARFT